MTRARRISLWVQAIVYSLAGINHFWHPAFYESVMPHWIPAHALLIAVTGIAEICGGIGLLINSTRRAAAWGICLLLVCILPVHVQMMIDYLNAGSPLTWLTILRLPLQGVLIWWAYFFTHSFREKNVEP